MSDQKNEEPLGPERSEGTKKTLKPKTFESESVQEVAQFLTIRRDPDSGNIEIDMTGFDWWQAVGALTAGMHWLHHIKPSVTLVKNGSLLIASTDHEDDDDDFC